MNPEGRAEGARELILAIFRLGVADYLGLSYGHDEPARRRSVGAVHRAEAGIFLQSQQAAYLADLIGLSSATVWAETCRFFVLKRGWRQPTAAA